MPRCTVAAVLAGRPLAFEHRGAAASIGSQLLPAPSIKRRQDTRSSLLHQPSPSMNPHPTQWPQGQAIAQETNSGWRRPSPHSRGGVSSDDVSSIESTSGSSSSSSLWNRIESSSNLTPLSAKSALMDESHKKECHGSISARRCARMTVAVAAAVALAILVCFATDQNSKSALEMLPSGSNLLEKVFGNRARQDHQLPQEGYVTLRSVPSFHLETSPDSRKYYYADDEPSTGEREIESTQLPSITKSVDFLRANVQTEQASMVPEKHQPKPKRRRRAKRQKDQ